MKTKIIYALSIFLILNACAKKEAEHLSDTFKAKVIIDFGGEKPIKTIDVENNRRLTALEALQYTAVIETHPVKEHVFVSSIDSIETIRGIKAWYYKVNGVSPKVLAINNPLNNGDTLRWIYKADVCSSKVDKK